MLKTGELANDVGIVLFGEEAVKNGLIKEVGGLAEALKKLYEFIKIDREKREIINKRSRRKVTVILYSIIPAEIVFNNIDCENPVC